MLSAGVRNMFADQGTFELVPRGRRGTPSLESILDLDAECMSCIRLL